LEPQNEQAGFTFTLENPACASNKNLVVTHTRQVTLELNSMMNSEGGMSEKGYIYHVLALVWQLEQHQNLVPSRENRLYYFVLV